MTNTVSGQVTQFTYDGDGARVKKVQSGVTTAFVGNAYEWTSTSTTKYYYLGGKRVALRTTAGVTYLHGDHLGSASLTTGAVSSSARYYPYGGDRWTSGSMPTDYKFTGQRQEAGFGLYDYGARYYDPTLGRFVSADSVVPGAGNPQALNRYAYTFNNPLKYTDPSGYDPLDDEWRNAFYSNHGYWPEPEDEVIRLFSLAFPDEWQFDKFYDSNKKRREEWGEIIGTHAKNRDWANVPDALARLAGWYKPDETDAFVRDVGSLFAGLQTRREEPDMWAAVNSSQRCPNVICRAWAELGPNGLPSNYIGVDPDSNVHHWAWAFVLGYNQGYLAIAMNTGREMMRANSYVEAFTEFNNHADVKLGNRGAVLGVDVHTFGASPQMIRLLWNVNMFWLH